jgi:hypothetical protein
MMGASVGQVASAIITDEQYDYYRNNNILYFDENDCITADGSFDGTNEVGLADYQAAFVREWHRTAETLSVEYGIPWETVVAQGIQESDSGRSNFAVDRNNFFGIGAFDSNPDGAKYYATPEEGWRGYYENIRVTSTYRAHGVFVEPTITNPIKYLEAIKAAGYASDPNYISSVSSLIAAIQDLSKTDGWKSSAELAVEYPEMLTNAAENAKGGSGSGSGNSVDACESVSKNLDLDALRNAFEATGGTYTKDGSTYVVGPGGSDNGCVTLTKWFIGEYTNLIYGGGHGGDVVNNLVAKNSGLTKSSTPRAPAIFSSRSSKWHGGSSSYGHTGIVVAVNGNIVTTLETWSGVRNNSKSQGMWSISYNIEWSPSDSVEFVYLGDHLK